MDPRGEGNFTMWYSVVFDNDQEHGSASVRRSSINGVSGGVCSACLAPGTTLRAFGLLHHTIIFPSKQIVVDLFIPFPPSPLSTFKLIRTYSRVADCQQECRLLKSCGLLVSPATI
jgi:hypothetical protein